MCGKPSTIRRTSPAPPAETSGSPVGWVLNPRVLSRCASSPRGAGSYPTGFRCTDSVGSTGSSAASGQLEYTYDPSGRRIAKDVDGMVTKPLPAYLIDTDAKLLDTEEIALLRRHESTGRPLGEAAFLDRIAQKLGRHVRSAKAGRKSKRREK